jgi:hypothetical protein
MKSKTVYVGLFILIMLSLYSFILKIWFRLLNFLLNADKTKLYYLVMHTLFGVYISHFQTKK